MAAAASARCRELRDGHPARIAHERVRRQLGGAVAAELRPLSSSLIGAGEPNRPPTPARARSPRRCLPRRDQAACSCQFCPTWPPPRKRISRMPLDWRVNDRQARAVVEAPVVGEAAGPLLRVLLGLQIAANGRVLPIEAARHISRLEPMLLTSL